MWMFISSRYSFRCMISLSLLSQLFFLSPIQAQSLLANSNGLYAPSLASAPTSPTAGQMYYNTTSGQLMIYTVDGWVGIGSGGINGLADQDNNILSSINTPSVKHILNGILDDFIDTSGIDTATSTNEFHIANQELFNNHAPGSESVKIALNTSNSGQANNTDFPFQAQGFRVNENNFVLSKVTFFPPACTGSGVYIHLYEDGAAVGSPDVGPTTLIESVAVGTTTSGVEKTVNFTDVSLINGKTYWLAITGTTYCISRWTGGTLSSTNRGWWTSSSTIMPSGNLGNSGGSYPGSELGYDIYGYTLSAANMNLYSQTFTSSSAPNSARLIIVSEEIDTFTVNTDLIAYVSRNGGANWTSVNLNDEGIFSGNSHTLTGTVDLSGQPSGTSMRYRISTQNSKALKIHAVSLRWW